jgi:hypothetical protein
MWQPTLCSLNLAGDGELIVLLWKTLAGFLDVLADGNPSEYRRGNDQAFQHDCSSQIKKLPPAPDNYPVADVSDCVSIATLVFRG